VHALFRIRLLGWCLLCVAASAAAADKPTLEKVRSHGAIYVGYAENAFPFSYLDAGGQAIGFSLDLCRPIVDAVKARLGLADLATVPVPVGAGAMQILFEAGTLDLYCAAATNTVAQQRTVAFSVSTFAAPIRALVRREANFVSLAALRGKTVVSIAGSSAESHVRPAALRQDLALGYRLARDANEALRQLRAGEAAALVHDEVFLRRLLLNAPDADQLSIVDGFFAVEPYGIVLRRNDPAFKKLVDETLTGLMKSGEFASLYARWFTAPVPPAGQGLGLPMSALLKQLIATPNDKGI